MPAANTVSVSKRSHFAHESGVGIALEDLGNHLRILACIGPFRQTTHATHATRAHYIFKSRPVSASWTGRGVIACGRCAEPKSNIINPILPFASTRGSRLRNPAGGHWSSDRFVPA